MGNKLWINTGEWWIPWVKSGVNRGLNRGSEPDEKPCSATANSEKRALSVVIETTAIKAFLRFSISFVDVAGVGFCIISCGIVRFENRT